MPTLAPGRRRLRTLLAVTAVGALLLTGCGSDTQASQVDDVAATASSAPTTAVTAPSGTPDGAGTSTDDGSTPDVPVDPAQVTEVPDDFPLAAGLPAVNGDDGSPVATTDRPTWTDVELCGEVVWSQRVPVATTDLAGASYTGQAEDSRSRVLALYADGLGVQQALDSLRDAYAACPDGTVGGTDQVYEVVEAEQGSATVTHRYRTDGRFDTGLEVIEIVAIGNALYLSSYYGEGGGSPETIASSIETAHEASRPVWRAMAVFSDRGFEEEPPATPTTDLADFPLPTGWPTEGYESGQAGIVFPVTDSEGDVENDFGRYTCGTAAPEPSSDPVGTLRGRYANAADYRARSLVVFADADEAVAWTGDLAAFYDDCPPQSGTDGFNHPVVVVDDTAVGGRSFGVAQFSAYDDAPAVGLATLHVVRVGRAVLLDATSNEGGAGPDGRERQARTMLDQMTADSADVVAAMCAYTDAGC